MKYYYLLFLVLSSCAISAKDYGRGDKTEQQFGMDSAHCELEGEQNRNTGGMGGLAGMSQYTQSFNAAFDACMRSKGYARLPPRRKN